MIIYYLLLLAIYIWPFGNLLTFNYYPLDFAVFAIFVSLIISPQRRKIFSGPIVKPLLIFLCAASFSLLFNFAQGKSFDLTMSSLYLLRLIIYPSLFFAARYIGIARLKKHLTISIVIFLSLCLTQYFVFPDMRFLKNLGFDDHYYRLIGSLFDPNFTGAILAALALMLIEKDKIILSLPFVGMLALTFSRASYLSFAVGVVYLLITHKKIKLFLFLLFLGVIVLLIPKPSGEGVNLLRTFSIFSRIESWQQGLGLFYQRPIFGWGYNTLRSLTGFRFQIDNSFIYLLATTGIVGLSSFINLLWVLRKSTVDRGVLVGALSLLVHSLFNNSLFFIFIMAFIWLSLGFGQKSLKEYK